MPYKIEMQIIPGLTQDGLVASNIIVAHESGNPNNTGTNSLENELRFMKNNYESAFVSHWVGGGGRIVQLAYPGKFQGGAGRFANPYSYAHVELARTNNAETFKKDYAAYIWLLRKLAHDAGIPKTLDTGSKLSDKGIKSHEWVSKNIGGTNHVDPYGYLESFGITRTQFKKDIENGLEEKKVYYIIQTGGLAPSRFKLFYEFLLENNIGWTAVARHGESARVRIEGLTPSQKTIVSNYLNDKGWYFGLSFMD